LTEPAFTLRAARRPGLVLGGTAVSGKLPVVGVVAGAFGPELAGGAHDLGAQDAQLPGDGAFLNEPLTEPW